MSVKIGIPQAVRAKFLLRSILGAKQSQGFNQGKVDLLRAVEPTLNDLAGNGISQAISEFFEATNEVATSPGGLAERENLLHKARNLANTLNHAADALFDAGESAVLDAKASVAKTNELVKEIAQLNKQIISTFGKGAEGELLIDQRNQLVSQLSEHVNVKVLEHSDGSNSVFMSSGHALVNTIESNEVVLTGGGNSALKIEIKKADGTTTKTSAKVGGRLGGLIDARDVTLKDARDGLDQLAFGLINAMNTLHQGGFGLDGSTGNNFFVPLAAAAGAAQSMSVSAVIEADVKKIAASQTNTLLPGDNTNMLAIVNLQFDATVVAGGKTVGEAYDRVVTRVSNDLRAAQNQAKFDTNRVNHFETLRDSVSSVSIQEEMVALSQFEHGFQAASRLMAVADKLYDSILRMV
jgi:flagellar hook-associated protein 1 FlgK